MVSAFLRLASRSLTIRQARGRSSITSVLNCDQLLSFINSAFSYVALFFRSARLTLIHLHKYARGVNTGKRYLKPNTRYIYNMHDRVWIEIYQTGANQQPAKTMLWSAYVYTQVTQLSLHWMQNEYKQHISVKFWFITFVHKSWCPKKSSIKITRYLRFIFAYKWRLSRAIEWLL